MKKKSNLAGDNIITDNASWTFGNNVAKNFSKHVSTSVPMYDTGHEIILSISDFFIKDDSICYDIGCSTGTLLGKLSSRHKNKKKISLIGIDPITQMIKQAKLENKNNLGNVKFINKDINKINLKKSDLIISYYTTQFISPRYRQNIIDNIYESLNWGGAFILFEKIRGADARFQDIYSSIYQDFKVMQGYSDEEILTKQRSLKGVLEPFSNQGNIGLLKRAGFKDITTIFQWVCFQGYLCIK